MTSLALNLLALSLVLVGTVSAARIDRSSSPGLSDEDLDYQIASMILDKRAAPEEGSPKDQRAIRNLLREFSAYRSVINRPRSVPC